MSLLYLGYKICFYFAAKNKIITFHLLFCGEISEGFLAD